MLKHIHETIFSSNLFIHIVMKKNFATISWLWSIITHSTHLSGFCDPRKKLGSGQSYHLNSYHLRIWVFKNLFKKVILDQTDMILDGKDGYWTWWTKIEVYTTHVPSTTSEADSHLVYPYMDLYLDISRHHNIRASLVYSRFKRCYLW